MRYSNRPKKVVRLTESELTRVIRRVIKESNMTDEVVLSPTNIKVSIDGDYNVVKDMYVAELRVLIIELKDGDYQSDEIMKIEIPGLKYETGEWEYPASSRPYNYMKKPNYTGIIEIVLADLLDDGNRGNEFYLKDTNVKGGDVTVNIRFPEGTFIEGGPVTDIYPVITKP